MSRLSLRRIRSNRKGRRSFTSRCLWHCLVKSPCATCSEACWCWCRKGRQRTKPPTFLLGGFQLGLQPADLSRSIKARRYRLLTQQALNLPPKIVPYRDHSRAFHCAFQAGEFAPRRQSDRFPVQPSILAYSLFVLILSEAERVGKMEKCGLGNSLWRIILRMGVSFAPHFHHLRPSIKGLKRE